MSRFVLGELCPHFHGRTTVNPQFHFDTMGGRYLVLSFFLSAGTEPAARFLAALRGMADRFDDDRVSFFGVSVDPRDETSDRLTGFPRPFRFFWDFDRAISRRFGAVGSTGHDSGPVLDGRPMTFVLDPGLRFVAMSELRDAEAHARWLAAILDRLPPAEGYRPAVPQAPVLVVPHVFGLDLCRRLIACYDSVGGGVSGFMREKDGITVPVIDSGMKSRRDVVVENPELRQEVIGRLERCVVPALHKAFQFRASRIERYIVACYSAEEGGHFRAHRDNTTKGTAHRQFAVSIMLNDDFDGGELLFPEFGRTLYRAPAGWAVVFSCSLLHSVRPVNRGRRLAFLPFLYDQGMAAVREANRRFIAPAPEAEPSGQPTAAGA